MSARPVTSRHEDGVVRGYSSERVNGIGGAPYIRWVRWRAEDDETVMVNFFTANLGDLRGSELRFAARAKSPDRRFDPRALPKTDRFERRENERMVEKAKDKTE